MKKFQAKLEKDKFPAIQKLGASSERNVRLFSELTPDSRLSKYEGMLDKNYPLWLDLTLTNNFLFLHNVALTDFGFPSTETSVLRKNAQGEGQPGSFEFVLQTVDHFEPRAFLRGELYGSSADMHSQIAFDFLVRGCAWDDEQPLGFAAETIAEAYAFEQIKRYKQAFFHYFTALDSYIETKREDLNQRLTTAGQLLPNIRLEQKLSAIVKAHLPVGKKIDDVKFWSAMFRTFKDLVLLRNDVAHNRDGKVIDKDDAEACFAVLALVVAMVEFGCFDMPTVESHYDLNNS